MERWAAGNLEDRIEPDLKFHLTVCQLTGNRDAGALLDVAGGQHPDVHHVRRVDRALKNMDVKQHSDIVDAIETGDADTAEATMRDHMASAAQVLVEGAARHSPGHVVAVIVLLVRCVDVQAMRLQVRVHPREEGRGRLLDRCDDRDLRFHRVRPAAALYFNVFPENDRAVRHAAVVCDLGYRFFGAAVGRHHRRISGDKIGRKPVLVGSLF